MIVVGLTGSIAMGKSEVAKIFAAHNIPVFDADKEVHQLYDSADGVALLSSLVPAAIENGRVSRQKLSAAILEEPTLLEKLEPLVHAEIATRRTTFLNSAKARGNPIAVVDVPLLFEKQLEKGVDVTIVISAPEKLQHARALARPGMTPDRLKLILARQLSDHEKRKRADIIIENDGDLATLRRRTETVIEALKRKAAE